MPTWTFQLRSCQYGYNRCSSSGSSNALVAADADVRAKGENGQEPLHWAATAAEQGSRAERTVAAGAVQALVAAGLRLGTD